MRTTTLLHTFICFLICFVFMASGLATAQEWAEYQNTGDGFKILFPEQPVVSNITWTSQEGFMLPGRVYRVDRDGQHYSVTAVDYTGIEKMAIERVKTCPVGAPLCVGTALSGPALWKHDVREAVLYATQQFVQRDAKVTQLTWSQHDLVEGNELQLTNADQSRTFAYIAMHEMKLFIVEATVPKGYPPATLFQTSMGWVDANGNGIRYQTIYDNEFHGLREYPVPAHAGGGGRAGGAGARGRNGGADAQ